jgi:hypothetical protein
MASDYATLVTFDPAAAEQFGFEAVELWEDEIAAVDGWERATSSLPASSP